MPSLIFYSSAYASLTLADTAASGAGGILTIDSNIALSANTTLATKQITFDGGIISLGNFDLVGADNAIDAPPVQIISLNGTGRLKGRFMHPLFYPEWVGVRGVDANDPNPFSNSAVFASANFTYLQAIEDYAAQRAGATSGDVVVVKFTKYMTALSSYVVNASHGICTIWEGINANYTRIYCSGGAQPRLLTGTSSASNFQDCYRSIGLIGNGPSSSPLIDFQNWCGLTWRDVYFSNASCAIRIQSSLVGGISGFSENCGGSNLTFAHDCGKPVQFATYGGTGSFRGWFIAGSNLWAVSAASASSFITNGNGADGSFSYAGKRLDIVITNHNTGMTFNLIESQSLSGIFCIDGSVDLETVGTGSNIRLGTGAGPVVFGGNVHHAGTNLVYGKMVFAEDLVLDGTINIRRGSAFLEELAGYEIVLAAGANAIAVAGVALQSIYHVRIYGGFSGILTATVQIDLDPIGTNHRCGVVKWSRQYNASFSGFDDTMFGVDSSGRLTITNSNFPANTFTVSGCVELFGV